MCDVSDKTNLSSVRWQSPYTMRDNTDRQLRVDTESFQGAEVSRYTNNNKINFVELGREKKRIGS